MLHEALGIDGGEVVEADGPGGTAFRPNTVPCIVHLVGPGLHDVLRRTPLDSVLREVHGEVPVDDLAGTEAGTKCISMSPERKRIPCSSALMSSAVVLQATVNRRTDNRTSRTRTLASSNPQYSVPGRQRTAGALASTTVFEGAGLGPASGVERVWIPFCAAEIPAWYRPVR